MLMSPSPLVPALWVLVLHLAAWAVGRPLQARLRRNEGGSEPFSQDFLQAQLLGFFVLAHGVLLLAWAHLLFPKLLVALVAALALVSLVQLVRRRPRLRLRIGAEDLPALGA